MVRVYLRGGVWKNSEDEILKAAVQKYGKQQWARVASLLNRKTAKQAKARWYEWLDPSIRKTEWSRAEDEKLLHLAKLMPAQWKTIAPLVGRTATQCQERYEELLDQAAIAASGTGADAAQGATTAGFRQHTLRPGQIDSHPETRPARPDPIDMDEDEMEMLQEARARLANTQGKKAKRKQREKMLAQAKRLAELQKRRELKQAGLLSKAAAAKTSRKRRREIDLGVEIPFYKPAKAGFHDTTDEAARNEALRLKRQRAVDLHQVNENLYRTRDREAATAKKREESRMRVLEETNEKYDEQARKLEQQQRLLRRPRTLLNLPDPTVKDADLARLAKSQVNEEQASSMLASSTGNSVTQTLLGDYTDRPLPTPMRSMASSSAPAARDLIQEATRLRMLEQAQTPLLPDSHAHEEVYDEDGKEANLDRKLAAVSTPAFMTDRAGVGGTPALTHRDELGLNLQRAALTTANDAISVGGSTFATSANAYSIRELARQERRAAKKARLELEAALAALPAPQYEYELAGPTISSAEESEDAVVAMVPDQADVEAAKRESERLEFDLQFRLRSTVMQRTDLPRPWIVPSSSTYEDEDDEVSKNIQQEMMKLFQHDAYVYPVPLDERMAAISNGRKKSKAKKQSEDDDQGMKPPPVTPVALEMILGIALNQSKDILKEEFESLLEEKIAFVRQNDKYTDWEDAAQYLTNETLEHVESRTSSRTYLRRGRCLWTKAKSDAEKIESLRLELNTLQEATEILRKKNDKVESKLTIVHGGYVKKANGFRQEILESFSTFRNAQIEEAIFSMLEAHEVDGAAHRLERLNQDITALKKTEAALQERYGELVIERRRLTLTASRVLT